jgi:hypothetical protein
MIIKQITDAISRLMEARSVMVGLNDTDTALYELIEEAVEAIDNALEHVTAVWRSAMQDEADRRVSEV